MTQTWCALYRVQLHEGFTFADASALAGYLDALGISHLYCSPILKAMPHSTHGYDVVDNATISPELGGEQGHSEMTKALQEAGIGQVLDIVPNHMATSAADNPWWWDVLKHGRDSHYASYFDIDWGSPSTRLKDLIMLPVLGDRYGVVLGAGEITLVEHKGEPAVAYFDARFPLAPDSLTSTTLEEASRDPVLLHEVLERQHYRLAFWRSDRELNYRRFFDVNELVGMRMSRSQVFKDAHEKVLGLIRSGRVDGLRIDHIDGLRDPDEYLQRLEAHGAEAVWVEKILADDETVPEGWRALGTTGYEFLNSVLGLFVDPSAEKALTGLYEGFIASSDTLDDIEHERKITVMRDLLSADMTRLSEMFTAICDAEPGYRDFTRDEIGTAICSLIAGLDVYRTYVQPERDEISSDDVARIENAAGRAAGRGDADPVLLRFLVDVLTLRHRTDATDEFVLRLQQSSGPVMAKAIEDTAFYVFNRFVALNEVGGNPGVVGRSVEDFHRRNVWTQTYRPLTMLTTSTHDTKRGEDVRARLAVLSEIPDRWAEAVWRWAAMNSRHRDDDLDRNTEFLLYQTLVGAWPIDVTRTIKYTRKATKEAKEQTSWIDPNETFDDALETFVSSILTDDDFVSDLDAFVDPLVLPGRINSLTQILLKLTCPGVPDIYQGNELWDMSLVDPDNRRRVDYPARAALLEEIAGASAQQVLQRWEEGAPKLFVISKALRLRRRDSSAFDPQASYLPLTASGPAADKVVAFSRAERVVTVVQRLALDVDWEATSLELPVGRWQNVFTGDAFEGDVAIADLFSNFPVSLLEKAPR